MKINMPIKKILSVIIISIMILSCLTSCGKKNDGPFAGQTLHVFNAGVYTGEFVLDDFEDLTGCTVVMDEFESNEQMYIKVANGDAYDVLIPSDYMIQRLTEEGLLQKLDQNKITCMDMIVDEIKDLSYDPGNEYSVPYFWGNVGIVYDKTVVDEEDLKKEGYGIFIDPKYKGQIYLYDSERDSMMAALKYLGYSMNTKNRDELNEAYEFYIQCVNTMDPEIVTDEVIDNMAQGRKAIALMYSGDASYVQLENPNMGFYCPDTGTNFWVDAMVIPKNAPNPNLAHEFINFISDYEAAIDNAETVGYTSPNKEVLEDMIGPGGTYSGIATYIPRTDNPNDEVFEYDAEARKIMAELWAKVKVAASTAN